MKVKSFFLLLFFVLCLSVSFAQVSVNTTWKLLDNSIGTNYRNNQNIFIRVLASTTADLPTGDVGVIIKPYETFVIPADAFYYFVKTFSGTGELAIDNFSSLGSVLIASPVSISGTVDSKISSETIGLIDGITEISSNTSDVESKLDSIINNTNNLDVKLDTIASNTKQESLEIATRTITLTANVNQEIVSTLTSTNRKFIEITTHDQDNEFTVNLGGAAIINDTGRKCYGGFGMKLPKSVNLNLISSETIKINVIEGGY